MQLSRRIYNVIVLQYLYLLLCLMVIINEPLKLGTQNLVQRAIITHPQILYQTFSSAR